MPDLAREAALAALEKCRRNNIWSSAAFDEAVKKFTLDSRSTALADSIFTGTIQNLTLCDYYIDFYCKKASKIEPKVRDILRISIYQLLFMDKIPDRAAVNEAVALSKKLGYSRAAGFVNAVLRKFTADNPNNLPQIPDVGTAKFLSVKYSHPVWLSEYLIKEHVYEFAEQFLSANNTVVPTSIQINTLKISVSDYLKLLEKSGVEYHKHEWLDSCILVSGKISSLPGFDEGLFYVQDPAAKSAVAAADLKPGMKVLDPCSAPGGKSLAAAIIMNNTGSILSCDIHEKKLKLITQNADRLGINIISTKASDARIKNPEVYDAVIADVPCSGYGVIRKKPEIRFKAQAERLSLPAIQSDIIASLADNVKSGGVLMYSTCTVFKEENEDVVNRFLLAYPCFEPEAFTLPNGDYAENGMYTFWPHINGTDGFFVAKLRRVK